MAQSRRMLPTQLTPHGGLKQAAHCLALLAAALAAGQGWAAGQELRVARSVMQVPDSIEVESVELPARVIGGDDDIKVPRKLAKLLAADKATSAVLVVESLAGAGSRYEWNEGCKSIKRNEHSFVYSPINTARDHCVRVVGRVNLQDALKTVAPEAHERASMLGWDLPQTGYYISAHFALGSGAFMSVTALVPEPFTGLPVTKAIPDNNASNVPNEVIAWAMALSEQVQGSVLSLSGQWRLPPIKQQ